MKFLCLVIVVFSGTLLAKSEPVPLDFENGALPSWQASSGSLTVSPEHFKSGARSLLWKWDAKDATLLIHDPAAFAKRGPKSGFAFWAYSESPRPARLVFDLLYQDKVVASGWFWMDFRGWRILGSGFGQTGLPANQPVDAIRLHAPAGMPDGRLFIDDAGLLMDYSAPPSLQTPWVDAPDGLKHPEISSHSADDPSLNRPWLPKRPSQVTAGELADIEQLERAFLTRKTTPGKGLPPGKLDELRKILTTYQIRRAGGTITGRPIDGGTALKPAGFIPVGDYLKTCDAVKTAYYQAKEPADAKELKRMFVDLTYHLLDQGWSPGFRLSPFENYPIAQNACFYAMKDVLVDAGLARPIAQALIDNFGSHGAGDFTKEHPGSSMDGLGYWHRELYACSLMFPTREEQLQHLRISQRFLNLALIEPNTIAPDGCTYHHGGFHYAYASYNIPRLLQVLEKVSPTRFRINTAAHERLKVFVRSLAFTSSHGEQACNLGMRAGTPMSTMGVESVARMLAGMGTPGGTRSFDEEMAAISLRLLAESNPGGPHPNFAKVPWKSWLDQGIKPAPTPTGFLAMNSGPIAIHRRDGWLASIAGCTSLFRCLEIYGWLQTNNYGRFARNGSLFITSTGNPPGIKESGWSYDGWNWCHFPGTTAIRYPNDQDIFDGYAFHGNANANAGGTHLGSDGVWGMDYSGFGVSFRKSYFCFGNRITSVTTGIRAKDTKNGNPLVTTIYQNAITPETEFVTLDGEPLKSFPNDTSLTFEKDHWLIDNKQTGYLIPAGNDPVRLGAKSQRWRYMTEKYLVDPKQNPISGEVTYQNVRGKIKDLATIEKFYRPSEGNFALAWFDHGPLPDPASCVYTLVIKTTPEEMRKLAARPSQRILRRDETGHIVHDLPSDTFGHAIYQPSENLHADGPLRSCDTPCFVMIRRVGGRLHCSLAHTSLKNSIARPEVRIRLTLDGKWTAPDGGAVQAKREGATTMVTLKPADNTPTLWVLDAE